MMFTLRLTILARFDRETYNEAPKRAVNIMCSKWGSEYHTSWHKERSQDYLPLY